MATDFDRWEKDPFFSAAEEVQESTDRLGSVYRRWIHEGNDASASDSNRTGGTENCPGELLRELQTALGTAKWQLDELEKAVTSNDEACSAGEDTRVRHDQFVSAIGSQISEVENSLIQRHQGDGETKLTWVQLDEGERDELALFLSLPPLPKKENAVAAPVDEVKVAESQSKMNKEGECQTIYQNLDDMRGKGAKGKAQGHRRIASANADIGSWNISFSPEDAPCRSFKESTVLPPPKVPSFSCLVKALESTSGIKLSKNGFRKLKGHDHHPGEQLIPLRNHRISQDNDSCCEESKSWFSCSDDDEYYDKQLYGWLGAFHRQLQRSQYHIRYGRPTQIILSVIFVLLLLVLFALRTI